MTKNNLKENPAKGVCWDLSDLYKSPKDPKIEKDFKDALAQAQEFEKKYRDKINTESLDAETLFKATQELERIYETIMKPWLHAQLVCRAYETQANDALFQETQKRYGEVEKHLLFFEQEWISLSDNLAAKLLADEKLAKYRHFLKNKRIRKPYLLSEAEEKIFREKSATGINAFRRLFLKIMVNIHYSLNLDGKVRKLSEKKIRDLANYHPSRRMRRQANKAFAEGLKANAELLTFIFNMVAQDKALEDKLRAYPHLLKERNLENEVEDTFVTRLLKAGEDNYDIVEKYYRLKGKILKIKNLAEYDFYAPIFPETKKKITFEDCKKIVLESYAKFSPFMAEIGEKFFQNHWIDAELREKKYGNAFCESCTPSVHPYVLVNFNGEVDDILAVAHEIGHGTHEYLAYIQGLFGAAPPPPDGTPLLVLAEISSIFGEILTFENLKGSLKDDRIRLGFLAKRIENSLTTFFRQIAYTRFELMSHESLREEGKLTMEKINQFWRDTVQSMFGQTLKLTEDYNYRWMSIPHFFRTPFYCYAYAFSFAIVTALYARWQKEGESFVPKYLEFLKAGRSMRPQEALKIVDIDLADPNFWQSGVDVLRMWVKEAERLAKSLELV